MVGSCECGNEPSGYIKFPEFHTTRGISCLAEELLASLEELCSM